MAPWATLNGWFILNSLDIRNETSHKHGRRKFFFQGQPLGDFPNISSGGGKSGEISFFPVQIEKTTFFA